MKRDIIKSIKNPLGLIAVFAGISEIAMTVTLLNLQDEAQRTFIWFVMLFPILLVAVFFFVLYTKPACLFSPTDYQDDTAYLRSIGISKNMEDLSIKVEQLDHTTRTMQKYLDKVAESSVPKESKEIVGKEKKNLTKLNSIHILEKNALYRYLSADLGISHESILSIISQSASASEITRLIQTLTGDNSKASRVERVLTSFSNVREDFDKLKTMIQSEVT